MTLDEYKDKYFGGDGYKALAQIAYESVSKNFDTLANEDECREIIKSTTSEQHNVYIEYCKDEIIRRRKNPPNLKFIEDRIAAAVDKAHEHDAIEETKEIVTLTLNDITLKLCSRSYIGYYLLAAIIQLFVIACLMSESIGLIIFGLIVESFALISGGVAIRKTLFQHNLKKHRFYLTTDVCKYNQMYTSHVSDGDGDTSYSLHVRLWFQSWKKFDTSSKLSNEAETKETVTMRKYYNQIREGDTCYLLHVGKSGKVSDVYDTKRHRLSIDDFEQKGDCFYPIKKNTN